MRLDHIDLLGETRSDDPAAALDVVPEPAIPAGPRRSLVRSALSLLAAVVSHAGFAALFIFLLQWREIAVPPERAIPVEIMLRMPGGARGGGGPGPAGGPTESGSPTDQAAPAEPTSAPKTEAAKAPEAPPAEADAEAKTPSPKPAPPPKLVEAPPEAMRAATQPKETKLANTEPEPPKPIEPKPSPPPAAAPQVLTSTGNSFAVAPAAPAKPDASPKSTAVSPPPAKDAAAELAAALPMDVAGLPSSFRAVLSGGGQFHTDEYKGVVFGKLGRSQAASEEARARHLRGQVLVSFTVDDTGKVTDLKVVHSSGTPAVDALALQMINDAAPFPAPPPDSKRVFTPVLSFGED